MNPAGFQIPLMANGNVSPCRFITGVSGAGNAGLAVQASGSTAMILGVSESYTRYPRGSPADDGYVAIAGESLPYRGPGTIAKLQLGGTVSSILVPLTSDANGKGVAQAPADGTTAWYGAIAMDTGAADQFIPVLVLQPTPTV